MRASAPAVEDEDSAAGRAQPRGSDGGTSDAHKGPRRNSLNRNNTAENRLVGALWPETQRSCRCSPCKSTNSRGSSTRTKPSDGCRRTGKTAMRRQQPLVQIPHCPKWFSPHICVCVLAECGLKAVFAHNASAFLTGIKAGRILLYHPLCHHRNMKLAEAFGCVPLTAMIPPHC